VAAPLPTLLAVLFADSHANSRAFAQRLGSRASATLSISEGDITSAWLETIRPAWAQSPAPIAGMTLPSSLFCLEQLAWQQGLRVVFHAEHVMLPSGRVEHAIHRGGDRAGLSAASLTRAGPRWSVRVAAAIAARPAAFAARRPGPSLAPLEPSLPEGSELLTSWVIAAA